ncbi:MAG: glycoside hydrolase N-terminal domain-containing protein [Asticcacaulis sp.]|nr:glycoside hydrolase N-terminal domain-containing protein [Asticcacaulis sp.]
MNIHKNARPTPKRRDEMALAGTPAENSTTLLRFSAPAEKWIEALPVGNGRTGAVVFGGTTKERLQLNHIELWSYRPSEDARPETLAALPARWRALTTTACYLLTGLLASRNAVRVCNIVSRTASVSGVWALPFSSR